MARRIALLGAGGVVARAAPAWGAGVGAGEAATGGLCGWPKSWANFTSFQIPTEELTTKVERKVVRPAIAWSMCG